MQFQTIENIKAILQAEESIPPDQKRLRFDNPWENRHTISDYDAKAILNRDRNAIFVKMVTGNTKTKIQDKKYLLPKEQLLINAGCETNLSRSISWHVDQELLESFKNASPMLSFHSNYFRIYSPLGQFSLRIECYPNGKYRAGVFNLYYNVKFPHQVSKIRVKYCFSIAALDWTFTLVTIDNESGSGPLDIFCPMLQKIMDLKSITVKLDVTILEVIDENKKLKMSDEMSLNTLMAPLST